MSKPILDFYFVIRIQGLDRMYYSVVGRDIGFNDGVRFLTAKEAELHADNLNSTLRSSSVQPVHSS